MSRDSQSSDNKQDGDESDTTDSCISSQTSHNSTESLITTNKQDEPRRPKQAIIANNVDTPQTTINSPHNGIITPTTASRSHANSQSKAVVYTPINQLEMQTNSQQDNELVIKTMDSNDDNNYTDAPLTLTLDKNGERDNFEVKRQLKTETTQMRRPRLQHTRRIGSNEGGSSNSSNLVRVYHKPQRYSSFRSSVIDKSFQQLKPISMYHYSPHLQQKQLKHEKNKNKEKKKLKKSPKLQTIQTRKKCDDLSKSSTNAPARLSKMRRIFGTKIGSKTKQKRNESTNNGCSSNANVINNSNNNNRAHSSPQVSNLGFIDKQSLSNRNETLSREFKDCNYSNWNKKHGKDDLGAENKNIGLIMHARGSSEDIISTKSGGEEGSFEKRETRSTWFDDSLFGTEAGVDGFGLEYDYDYDSSKDCCYFLPIIHPYGPLRVAWDCMVMVLLVYTCIEVPFTIAFGMCLLCLVQIDWYF